MVVNIDYKCLGISRILCTLVVLIIAFLLSSDFVHLDLLSVANGLSVLFIISKKQQFVVLISNTFSILCAVSFMIVILETK